MWRGAGGIDPLRIRSPAKSEIKICGDLRLLGFGLKITTGRFMSMISEGMLIPIIH